MYESCEQYNKGFHNCCSIVVFYNFISYLLLKVVVCMSHVNMFH